MLTIKILTISSIGHCLTNYQLLFIAYLEDKPLTASGNISFFENKRKIPNTLLVLNSVTMDNRGEFVCIGKNDVVKNAVRSNPSYVRIKG